MIDEIKDEFLSYAKEQAPKEACALAVVVKGRLRLWKCENMAKIAISFACCLRTGLRRKTPARLLV